ncbi:hypothetical protein [Saccharothrix sp. NRRL B-16348]|uniref:hypothetical protein n=1 Tax=Saccharothrix sp. NRRL B-16348 TaxID=1415542 RepID=UPI0012F97384|nr:hypothetical protein [Saccharothrix sp. NRRL B-16348]
MNNDLYADAARAEADYYAHAADLGFSSEYAEGKLRRAVFDTGREGRTEPLDLARSRLAAEAQAGD